MDGLDDLFRDPNGPAYQTREERVGPPLAYVAEKLGHCLEELQAILHERVNAASLGEDGALAEQWLTSREACAFYYALVAYLALINMLALANDSALVTRLATYDRDEFADWLWHLGQEGSVSG